MKGASSLWGTVCSSLSAPPGLAFTAKTAEMRVASNLEILDTPPLTSGNSIFFPFSRGITPGFMSTFTTRTEQKDSLHTMKLLNRSSIHRGSVVDVAVLPRENLVLALADDKDTLYCYKHYTSGNQRLQSAWSKFTFDGADIRGIGFYDNSLHIVVRRGLNGLLSRCNLSQAA